jgi:hypothetical protein
MNHFKTCVFCLAVTLALAGRGVAQNSAAPAIVPPSPSPDVPASPPSSIETSPAAVPDAAPSTTPVPFDQAPAPTPWTTLPQLGAGEASPPPGSILDSSRSMSGMSMEGLALGEGMNALPRIGYTVTWYPDEPLSGQGKNLSIIRQDFHVSAPIYKDGCDVISLSAGVRNEILDTDGFLPVLGTPFPSDLWNVNFGAGYHHQFDNGWSAGLNLHVGSASDDPFANINQMTLGATGSLRIPVRERDAWIFTLSYSNNTDFANRIPLPGVAYLLWPTDNFRALIGIPFARVWYEPIEKVTIDLSYRFLYTFQGRVTYRFAPRWKAYVGYSTGDEGYFLVNSPDPQDRLFYAEQRVYGGLGWVVGKNLSLDLTSGLAFDRFYSFGQNFRGSQSDKLSVGDGPFISLAAQWRF